MLWLQHCIAAEVILTRGPFKDTLLSSIMYPMQNVYIHCVDAKFRRRPVIKMKMVDFQRVFSYAS